MEIKTLIEREIEKTKVLIQEYLEFTKPIAPENAIGRISRMDAINNKSINDAALRKARAKLSHLESALDNVDHPEFGQCLKCKNEIPIQRIMLVPQSKFCVNCAR